MVVQVKIYACKRHAEHTNRLALAVRPLKHTSVASQGSYATDSTAAHRSLGKALLNAERVVGPIFLDGTLITLLTEKVSLRTISLR